MRRAALATLATAATVLAVSFVAIGQPSAQPHPSTATQPTGSSPTPHPLNTPPTTATPEPLAPPPVGPYRPQERPRVPPDRQQQPEDVDVMAEIGPELSAGTRRLVRDVDSGALPAARATRVALAMMGYLDFRGVPARYRGDVKQADYLALAFAVEVVAPRLSDAETDRIAAEVDAHVHGSPTP
jgi:hypothetical protein